MRWFKSSDDVRDAMRFARVDCSTTWTNSALKVLAWAKAAVGVMVRDVPKCASSRARSAALASFFSLSSSYIAYVFVTPRSSYRIGLHELGE